MMKLTLNSLFKFKENDGIFTYLNNYDVPWKSDIDVDILDLDYHTKHGTKIIGKAVQTFLTEDGLSTQNKNKLSKLIYYKNKVKWEKLYSSLALYDEFDPLNNTDWKETERLEHRGTNGKTYNIGQKSTTFNKGQQVNNSNKGAQINNNNIGSQTFTEGAQSNTTGAQSNSVEGQVSAENVSSYSNKDKSIESLGARTDSIGEKINTNSTRSDSMTEGARQDSYTDGARQDTNIEGAQTNSESGNDSFTDIHTIERAGNIGVTTSGQLIDDFRRVVNWQFFDEVYKDINDVLVLSVYGDDNETIDDYTFIIDYILPIASDTELGGIKVGRNLTIEEDGTLNAQAEAGDVQSVNGKTGIVILTASDVGAATPSDIKVLSVNSKTGDVTLNASDVGAATSQDISDAIALVRQVPEGGNLQQVLRRIASGYFWDNVREVPSTGTTGQLLTKTENGYEFQTLDAGGSEKYVSIFHDLTTGRTNVGLAMKMDNKTSEIYVGCENNDDTQRQAICHDVDWIDTELTRMCGNQARMFWDGKIAFLSSSNDNNANINKYGNVFLKTSNPDYINDVTTVNLEYKDVAQAEYIIDLGKNIKHFAACCRQYNSFNNYKPSLYYTDAQNIEHDITEDATLKIHWWDKLGIISYDFPDDTYVISIKVVFTGYRTKGTAGYY